MFLAIQVTIIPLNKILSCFADQCRFTISPRARTPSVRMHCDALSSVALLNARACRSASDGVILMTTVELGRAATGTGGQFTSPQSISIARRCRQCLQALEPRTVVPSFVARRSQRPLSGYSGRIGDRKSPCSSRAVERPDSATGCCRKKRPRCPALAPWIGTRGGANS